ncbi:hypothetical protein [Pseudidiomarina taiwanensis]|uniref:Uncharacterized protein n=1 Tax=Pseudidiomarina taiwanensis TaxID=337250 RepID=A0A432ZEP6_9GAMM|nr:hypothetical protein [Pseudidiomarina taiwanensis]RUO76445.1 hypothetical protein CWI83_08780 [Pseudidiomarina taiwanensis]
MTSNNEKQTKQRVIKHLQGYRKSQIEVWDLNRGNKQDFIKSLEKLLLNKDLSILILEVDR